MMTKYLFRREDNDELIWLTFAEMMAMDSLGSVRLEDGVIARRCRHLESQTTHTGIKLPPKEGAATGIDRPIVSDSLGFTHHQLEGFEADRVRHGFSGVEFKPDPHVPGFFQAHFSGRAEWQRYIAHRGMTDRNSTLGSGSSLTQEDLDNAAALVKRSLAERAG